MPRCEAQRAVAWDQPGKLIQKPASATEQYAFDVARPPVAAKDRPPFTAMAKQVFGILLAAPILAHPVGFDVSTFGSAASSDIDGRTEGGGPHLVGGYMRVRAPVYLDFGNRIGQSGEAFALEITVVSNSLKRVAEVDRSIGKIEDDQGAMYFPPPSPSGAFRGYQKYGSLVMMTHRTAPIFRPVNQERLMKRIIAEAEKKAAEFDKAAKDQQAMLDQMRKNSPDIYNKMSGELQKMGKGSADQAVAYRKFVEETRARLAAMPADQRQAPAHIKPNLQTCCSTFLLGAANEPGAQEIVALNPDFYDWKLPPTAPQIFTVVISQQVQCPRGKLDEKFAEELDWHALEGLLK
jgi:hypothetical protein